MTQYVGIRSEGGLIPYDVLDKIAKEESGLGQQTKDFGLPTGRRLTDEIARAWSDAQDYWHIFQRRAASLPESEAGTTLTRKWITDLLNEQLLGYELTYQPSGAVIAARTTPFPTVLDRARNRLLSRSRDFAPASTGDLKDAA